MLRIFAPGVTPDQVAFYTDLFAEIARCRSGRSSWRRALQRFFAVGPLVPCRLAGQNEQMHRVLMREAGFWPSDGHEADEKPLTDEREARRQGRRHQQPRSAWPPSCWPSAHWWWATACVGIGWADDGPALGLPSLYLGLFLIGACGWTLLRALLGAPAEGRFARATSSASVLAVLLPMVVYVAALVMAWASTSPRSRFAYFMKRHGRYGWPLTVAVVGRRADRLLPALRALVPRAAPRGAARSGAGLEERRWKTVQPARGASAVALTGP